MDTKLQILIKQYQQTGDQGIGVRLANAVSRVSDPAPTVWVSSFLDVGDGIDSDVELFSTKEAAMEFAAKQCVNVLRHHFPRPLSRFENNLKKKNFEYILTAYNRIWYENDRLPEIQVYTKLVR